jgi:hypothetical protein
MGFVPEVEDGYLTSDGDANSLTCPPRDADDSPSRIEGVVGSPGDEESDGTCEVSGEHLEAVASV